jgi:hemoglobin/transferrin/lactoferrin receptor protein
MPVPKRTFFTFLLTMAYSLLPAQQRTLSGQVVDELGSPILGVLVFVSKVGNNAADRSQNSIAQAITNLEGEFEFCLPITDSLQIGASHLGFATGYKLIDRAERVVVITLARQALPLEEVTVYSLKNEKMYSESALPVGVLTADQWRSQMPGNLAEAAERLPGVTRSSDGMWANSLQIRGFGEDRFVRLIDGNRIETATDLQGALSTIDMQDIEKVEVIKGGISSLYGSGALGGVINVITKKAAFSTNPYLHGTTAFNFHSVNTLLSPSATLYAGSQKWNAKLHLGYRGANNAQSPEGPIPNSQFTDWNVSGYITVAPVQHHELQFTFQKFDGNAGIPGGATFPTYAEATYRDFDRGLLSVEYLVKNPWPKLKVLSAKIYHQSIFRNVSIYPNIAPKTNNHIRTTPTQINPSARHKTNGIQIESRWKFGGNQALVFGFDGWQRDLESKRTREILQESIDADERVLYRTLMIRGETPIPISTFTSTGVYAQYDWEMGRNLDFVVGGRLDWVSLTNETSSDPDYLIKNGEYVPNPPGQLVIYEKGKTTSAVWATHAGVAYQMLDGISLTAAYGRSFRAPSLEERYKYINLGNRVELGNADLVPEQGNFIDVGIKKRSAKLQFAANVFFNRISKMITMSPADSVVFVMEGDMGLSEKTFARKYQNIDEATITGFEMSVDWQAYPSTVVYGQVSYVRGIESNTKENLPGIVPLNSTAGLRRQLGNLGDVEFRTRIFNAQDKIAEGEVKSDGYWLLDCYATTSPITLGGSQLQFSAGIENIANTKYRSHLSTNRGNWALEPGRNVKLRLSVSW